MLRRGRFAKRDIGIRCAFGFPCIQGIFDTHQSCHRRQRPGIVVGRSTPPPIPKYCRQPSNVSDSSGNPRRRRYPQTSHPPTVSTTCRTSSFSPTSHQIRSSLGLGLHQELQLQYKSPLGLTIRNRRRTPSSFVVVADQGISDHISSSSCGAFRMIRRAGRDSVRLASIFLESGVPA